MRTMFGCNCDLKFSEFLTFLRAKLPWDSSFRDSIRYVQRTVLFDEDSTGVDPDPGRCPGRHGASMVTNRIQSNSVFLPCRLFLSPLTLLGETPHGKSVKIKRRSRGMVQISSTIVRVAKSDEQVDLGEMDTRSIMFGHTLIRGSDTDF